jgi:hypothetical protein
MKNKDTKDLASTKHKGLPEHVKKEDDKKKKKSKDKKKKSELILYLSKLANNLDEELLFAEADLVDTYITEILES